MTTRSFDPTADLQELSDDNTETVVAYLHIDYVRNEDGQEEVELNSAGIGDDGDATLIKELEWVLEMLREKQKA